MQSAAVTGSSNALKEQFRDCSKIELGMTRSVLRRKGNTHQLWAPNVKRISDCLLQPCDWMSIRSYHLKNNTNVSSPSNLKIYKNVTYICIHKQNIEWGTKSNGQQFMWWWLGSSSRFWMHGRMERSRVSDITSFRHLGGAEVSPVWAWWLTGSRDKRKQWPVRKTKTNWTEISCKCPVSWPVQSWPGYTLSP